MAETRKKLEETESTLNIGTTTSYL